MSSVNSNSQDSTVEGPSVLDKDMDGGEGWTRWNVVVQAGGGLRWVRV